jgi:2-C-methyl-D-erythritol 2,4-cyclodiphosphate synthase
MLRIGHGFDVHRLVAGRPLVLGGVHIDYERGLLGHSDADVAVHAIADAVLGAARLGDIGLLFPDTDPAWEGADSLDLLSRAMDLARKAGFELLDCDCTIAAEAPRLSPLRDEMRANVATALGVDVASVGIKATTTEGLGYTGRGEGICAWAVALFEDGHTTA